MNVQDVQVVRAPGTPQEARTETRAGVQTNKIYFEITSPVYSGDHIETDDPRGGTRTLEVKSVKLFDQRNNPAFAGMSYLLANVEDVNDRVVKPRGLTAPSQVFNGPVINVSGGKANVAWGHSSVVDTTAGTEIAPGFEDLASRLAEAIQVLQSIDDLDDDDRLTGEDAANRALVEITREEPDRKALKSFVLTVKGVLSSAIGSTLGGVAKDLIASLVV